MVILVAAILAFLLFLLPSNLIFAAVKINEFSSASNPEWVELYNTGSEINLNGWTVLFHDNPTTSQKITLGSNDTIPAGGFKIVERDYTNLVAWLNNTGDAIILKDSSGIEQDSVRYGGATGSNITAPLLGQSAGRNPDGTGGWTLFLTPTKGSTNNTSISTPTPSPSPSLTPTSNSSPSTSQSSAFTISNIPSQINSDQSFNVSVNLSLPNNPDTTYYLAGAFKIVNGTRYFGLTKKDSGWVQYSSASFSNQYKITTNSSGSWTGNLEVKPDIEDSDYKGSGDYTFKVARYTSAGSGPTWSNESTINIVSTGSSDQGGSISQAASDSPPSKTYPSTSPSVKGEKTSLSKLKSYDSLVYHSATVAAATASANSSPLAEVKGQQRTNYFSWVGVLMIISGTLVLAFVYLRNRNLPHAISNLFRKRD